MKRNKVWTVPVQARPLHEIIDEERERLIEWARENGKGELVGTVVRGTDLIYTFSSGYQLTRALPDGSRTDPGGAEPNTWVARPV